MTPNELATQVNAIYATAIVDFLSLQSRPVDNHDLIDGVLGGTTPDEFHGSQEPYNGAFLNLCRSHTIATWKVPHGAKAGEVRTCLWANATEAEKVAAIQTLEDEAPPADEYDPDDTTTYRTPYALIMADNTFVLGLLE